MFEYLRDLPEPALGTVLAHLPAEIALSFVDATPELYSAYLHALSTFKECPLERRICGKKTPPTRIIIPPNSASSAHVSSSSIIIGFSNGTLQCGLLQDPPRSFQCGKTAIRHLASSGSTIFCADDTTLWRFCSDSPQRSAVPLAGILDMCPGAGESLVAVTDYCSLHRVDWSNKTVNHDKIWRPTPLTCCAASSNLIATGDSEGTIALFRTPDLHLLRVFWSSWLHVDRLLRTDNETKFIAFNYRMSHARICRIDDEVTREFWIGGRLTAPPHLDTTRQVLYTPLYSGLLATRLSTRHRAFVSNLDSPPHAIGIIGSELVIVT